MSDGITRRRWPYAVLAVILIVVGGPLAWRYRPLNSGERRLAGKWEFAPSPESLDFPMWLTLAPNRRFQLQFRIPAGSGQPRLVGEGSWCFESDRLVLISDGDVSVEWTSLPRMLLDIVTGSSRGDRIEYINFRFESKDRFSADGPGSDDTLLWNRTTDPATSS